MGWLSRLFGRHEEEKAKTAQPVQNVQASAPATTATATIPPERMGLDGKYDQSGLAKRVAYAFDQDSELDDMDSVWVAQTDSTVVLKGKVPSQQLLSRMVTVAKGVNGATSVDTSQLTVG
ncbi:BON domain-containing protein [Planktothrix sp. FACHB-1365]|uniref:BON domain-containing protein n=1 Tax=Planktothrix sp. FACHB-1365 TaxID=2692855 RepID=UPI0016875FAE|nr:BON domain-containing protein [Planktothrix sp. FACHB-1365]MBD2481479.1 BON domain-containing protein [Planktothrix sp. FACHB-1365]